MEKQFIYQIYLREFNGTRYVYNCIGRWVRPFYYTQKRDETLDCGRVRLSMSTRSKPIKPFSRVRIDIFEMADGVAAETPIEQIYCLTAAAKRTRRTYDARANSLFDWEITLIELTKLFERRVIDSMTVTKYLNRTFDSNSSILIPSIQNTSGVDITASGNNLYGPKFLGDETEYPSITTLFTTGVTIIPEVTAITSESITVTSPSDNSSESNSVHFDEKGMYQIVYHGDISKYVVISSGGYYQKIGEYTITYYVECLGANADKPCLTITDVINRILSAGITRRVGDPQEFTFDANQASQFSTVQSPEFSFTRCTLFEALLQIGGFIQGIPRLVVGDDENLVVKFDLLGETEQAPLSTMLYEDMTVSADDYCGILDSPAENLLDTSQDSGSVVDPGNGIYQTVRCDDSKIEISANNMIIRTKYPIYRIIKVECGYLDSNTIIGDITSFVYEEAEYATLSSYVGSSYPYSKGWAIKYRQGQPNIEGLNFEMKVATQIGTLSNYYAINNIIDAKLGEHRSLTDDYVNLGFRITYIPMTKTRVTQAKAYWDSMTEDFTDKFNNTLIFNQGANLVESSSYGNKMKGAIARLGQEVVRRTYYYSQWSNVPQVGQFIGNYCITQIDFEFDFKIKATLTLTPNYNRLSDYVGVNSNVRFYDISEKQSVERNCVYNDYVIIGDLRTELSNMQTLNGRQHFMHVFDQMRSNTEATDVSAAVLSTFDSDGTMLKEVVAPVKSYPFGNSLSFDFGFDNSYSAGYQSVKGGLVGTETVTKRIQQAVRYSDAYGEFNNLHFSLYAAPIFQADYATQKPGGASQLLPKAPAVEALEEIRASGSSALVIMKDSREQIKLSYKLHSVANRETIVIGTALAINNPLIGATDTARAAVLYLLPRKLSMLQGIINLTGAYLVGDFTSDSNAGFTRYGMNGYYLDAVTNPTQETYQSWALIDPTTNQLYIGENVELAPSETAPRVYFNFIRP